MIFSCVLTDVNGNAVTEWKEIDLPTGSSSQTALGSFLVVNTGTANKIKIFCKETTKPIFDQYIILNKSVRPGDKISVTGLIIIPEMD